MDPSCVWIRLELPDGKLSSLQRDFPEVNFIETKEADSKPNRIDAVFTDEPLPDDLVERMPRLRWLQVTRGGVYPFLSAAVKSRPIQVTGSKGIHGRAFAEFAIACIFALAKRLPRCWEAQSRKSWERLKPEELEGKCLGIVGLGTVGSELAKKAGALGLRVIATKRNAGPKPDYVDEIGPPEFLPSLLARSDFVVLSIPSVPSTDRLLGKRELRSMKRSAYLINLTAGRAIEENLLAQALREGWIAGAALDAFARQPLPPDSELWGLPNVIISPRIAGAAANRWDLLIPIFADNLQRFLAREPLRNLVDKERGY